MRMNMCMSSIMILHMYIRIHSIINMNMRINRNINVRKNVDSIVHVNLTMTMDMHIIICRGHGPEHAREYAP